MKLSPLLAVIVRLVAVVSGVSAGKSPIPMDKDAQLMRPEYACENSSFENRTSLASPKASDCLKLAGTIPMGGWIITGQRTVSSYGTCAFGATPGILWVEIRSTDIIRLIQTSVDKFESNGLIGAEGDLHCRNNMLNWGIYHTK